MCTCRHSATPTQQVPRWRSRFLSNITAQIPRWLRANPSDVLQLKTSPVHGSAHHGPAPRVPSASLCRGPLVYARPSLAFGGASPLPPPIPPPLPTVQPAWGTCALWRGRGAHFGCHSLLLEASPCITRPWDCRAK